MLSKPSSCAVELAAYYCSRGLTLQMVSKKSTKNTATMLATISVTLSALRKSRSQVIMAKFRDNGPKNSIQQLLLLKTLKLKHLLP